MTTGWRPRVTDLQNKVNLAQAGWRVPQDTAKLPAQPNQPFTQPKPVAKQPQEQPVSVPFWQRALEVFTAPFEWVDNYLIKPGLAAAGTGLQFVPEVARLPGEDFWEWKKRSWADWDAPGLDINIPWSNDPWRLDMKGVMEFAPWLLIPGAGQVGAGARAARGIAGVLGKLGKTGRALGYAVEYSPWGIVEKTAGVAIKGGIKGIGRISAGVSTRLGERVTGKYVPPPVQPEVQKLTKYMEEAVIPARKEFKKLLPELRARQEASSREALARYRRGEIPFNKLEAELNKARAGGVKAELALTKEALAARQAKSIRYVENKIVNGEIGEATGRATIAKLQTSAAFKPVQFTESEVKTITDMIVDGTETGLVRTDSRTAMLELLTQGKLPQPHNISDWAQIYGREFASATKKLAGTSGISGSKIVDALNLPRAVLASTDLSATLRQGLFLGLLHPTKVPVWFGKQVKAFFSEKLALEADDVLRKRPMYKDFVRDGGYIAPITDIVPTRAEELFMSDIARRIPFIRRSERAFITYLNHARLTAYEAAHGAMVSQGATPAQFKLLTDFINMASGRGTLPKSLEQWSPVLNTVLFSPRLQAATLELPRQIGRMLISENPYMRKEAAKALITFMGGGAAILGLMKGTGNKVELDPRAGDFGKVIIGDTRLDIWRGYLQYIRFATQLLTGERKSAYGNMNKAERSEIAFRFMQSKSSPAFGLMVDILRGENYMGKPIFSDTTGFSKAAMERVLPLAIQDTIDAMEMNGMGGAWVAAPVTLGIGALTYVNDLVQIKRRIAKEAGFETWDEIDPKTQREIQNRNTELQAAYIDFDRQVMGTAWGDWRNSGLAIEDTFKDNVRLATAQYQVTGDGVQFREKIGDAFTAKRGGYDAREREARFEDIVNRMKIEDTAESLASLGPEQLGVKMYNEALYGDDMYDEFGDYRFDEAEVRKQQLRQELGDEMIDYIEEYQGLKYEDLPQEFQELSAAKQALRPYWAVQSKVEQMFGKQFAESNRGKSLIGKYRKQLRLSNPELERYYQLFYARQ